MAGAYVDISLQRPVSQRFSPSRNDLIDDYLLSNAESKILQRTSPRQPSLRSFGVIMVLQQVISTYIRSRLMLRLQND